VRLVLDTNVLVASLTGKAAPRRLVEAARAEVFQLCTSQALLAELLHVLACAIVASADLIVSGDSDLLELRAYQGIPILKPADALARISAGR